MAALLLYTGYKFGAHSHVVASSATSSEAEVKVPAPINTAVDTSPKVGRPLAVVLKPAPPANFTVEKAKPFKFKPLRIDIPNDSLRPLPVAPRSTNPIIPAKRLEVDPKATRPASGTMLTSVPESEARGKFTVTNGSDEDATVFVVPVGEKSAIAAFYIRAGDEHTIEHIPDGTYSVFVRTGRDWHNDSQSFTRGESLKRFEDTFAFRTKDDGITIQSSRWTVTLHPVIDGNAKSRSVAAEDFPTARHIDR